MGFLTTNTSTTASQIIAMKNSAQESINNLSFNLSTLKAQKLAMESNESYSAEDVAEVDTLINNLLLQISLLV